MGKPLIIEICPNEPRADICTSDGESVMGSEWQSDVMDCCASGNVESACEYLQALVEFRIVARNDAGVYENRLATDAEKAATCKAIYFEIETDFSDVDKAEQYLIWESAIRAENEGE